MTIYYHHTDRPDAIVREGFRDPEAPLDIDGRPLTGVLLSDWPVGAEGGRVLQVEVPTGVDLSAYAIIEFGAVTEWCVPAAVINQHATVRALTDKEVQEAVRERAFVRVSRGS